MLLLWRYSISYVPFPLAFILSKNSSFLASYSALLTIAQAVLRVLAVTKVAKQAYFAVETNKRIYEGNLFKSIDQ